MKTETPSVLSRAPAKVDKKQNAADAEILRRHIDKINSQPTIPRLKIKKGDNKKLRLATNVMMQ